MQPAAPFVLIALVFSALGCSSSSGDPSSGASSLQGCEGPLGKPTEPASLPACCPEHGGKAHCVAMAKVPASLQSVVGKCADGAACVPDPFIATGGVFTPRTCTAFGKEGRCVSPCVPAVAEKAALLKQDVCDDGELCVPCINPLDKQPTGVCGVAGKCVGT